MKSMAFQAVPDVLRFGIVLDYQKNRKDRGVDSYVLAAPVHVKSGDYADDYYVAAAVYRGENDQHFYLHEVAAQNMKKGQAESFKTPYEPQNGTRSNPARPSIQNILEHLVYVKRIKGGDYSFSTHDLGSSDAATPSRQTAALDLYDRGMADEYQVYGWNQTKRNSFGRLAASPKGQTPVDSSAVSSNTMPETAENVKQNAGNSQRDLSTHDLGSSDAATPPKQTAALDLYDRGMTAADDCRQPICS